MRELRYIEICDGNHNRITKTNPWRVTLIYFIVGMLWVFYSDALVSKLTNSQVVYEFMQMVKGSFYIIVTSLGLYFFMNADQQNLLKANKRLSNSQDELLTYSEELISSEDEMRKNIREIKKITKDLIDEKKLNREIFDHTNTSIVIWNNRGDVVKINKKFSDDFGYDERIIGINILEFIRFKEDREVEKISKCLEDKREINGLETYVLTHSKRKLNVLWNVSKMEQRIDSVELNIGFGIDITNIYEKENELNRIKKVDVLTNLWHKNVFYCDVKNWIENSRKLTFYLIGIDNFSSMNNLYGQEQGDAYLKKICAIVSNIEDIKAYRWNGDEILIIEEGTANHLLRERTEYFQSLFGKERILNNIKYSAKISIGVLLQNGDYFSVDQITQRLHIALNKAKERGKNQVVMFKELYLEEIIYKNNLEESIKSRLENNTFELYLQPIYELKTNHIEGYEILLRCMGSKEQNIGELISYAENTGQIIEIDRWVIEKAFALLSKEKKFFRRNKRQISINISAQSFYLSGFTEFLKSKIRKHKIDPAQINLEITEYSLLKNISDSEKVFMNLKSMGFKMSLDDFGTEYSSLNYLSKLPFDTLKVDKSYVDNIKNNSKDRKIIRHLVALAKDLDMKIIAEGIETQEQKEILMAFGCTYGQGYLMSKPLDLMETLNNGFKSKAGVSTEADSIQTYVR